ncbi:MAG: hypothetical protein JSU59_07000 [Nitrospirota bacterium]|nr:MAG: hypothetical protein JSU59_07000 [Nitrospirota bacterium]
MDEQIAPSLYNEMNRIIQRKAICIIPKKVIGKIFQLPITCDEVALDFTIVKALQGGSDNELPPMGRQVVRMIVIPD